MGCPVAFSWCFIPGTVKRHETLCNGAKVYVHKQVTGSRWDAVGRHTEIWIHAEIYERFRGLSLFWASLEAGDYIVCRAPRYRPDVLYNCGTKASRMTCARICHFSQRAAHGWLCAGKTKQYRCQVCENFALQGRPCTGWWSFFVIPHKLEQRSRRSRGSGGSSDRSRALFASRLRS